MGGIYYYKDKKYYETINICNISSIIIWQFFNIVICVSFIFLLDCVCRYLKSNIDILKGMVNCGNKIRIINGKTKKGSPCN